MGLIEDKNIKMLSDHKLPDRHTIRHEGNLSVRRSFFLKPDIIANLLAQRKSHFKGHSLSQGDCTYPSWLGDNYFIITMVYVLRDLCGLSTSSFPTNYCDFVVFYRVYYLLFVLEDGQALLLLLILGYHFLSEIL